MVVEAHGGDPEREHLNHFFLPLIIRKAIAQVIALIINLQEVLDIKVRLVDAGFLIQYNLPNHLIFTAVTLLEYGELATAMVGYHSMLVEGLDELYVFLFLA